MSTTPAIEVCGVTKRFGAVTALDNVSFGIEPGELFFLLGPSGCGKTTLLRILAGLETPDAGTIRFNGRDVAELPPHERGAPMVFQNYALWPHLNVRDNVAFGLVERKVARREIATRVDEALDRVGLQGYGARMPGQLSGGQQQRVVLARALVLNPPVVLLDEPLSNLDAKLRVEMRAEIEELHARTSITFVYVTHDQVEALSLADRMVVMSAGSINAIGTPLDLYNHPPNTFCAEFLGEANLIAGTITAVAQDCLILQTDLGVWQAMPPRLTVSVAGSRVQCVVRPENIVLAGADAGHGNTFEACVKRLRVNGATVTVLLESNGTPLKATLLNESTSELKVGQTRRWQVGVRHTTAISGSPPSSHRAGTP